MDTLLNLLLLLLLGQNVSTKDIEEYDIEDNKLDQMTYNESLKMFNEAKKDVDEIKESMKKTNGEIRKNVELQNEVTTLIK